MLPELVSKNDNITMINSFLGLNKNAQIAENEFAEMVNITNDYFPVIGSRKIYNVGSETTDLICAYGGEYISFIAKNEDGDYKLFYGEIEVCDVSGKKESQIVKMGAYLCVFPDGIVYNTETGEIKSVKNTVVSSSTKFTLSKLDGSELNSSNTISSKTEPSDKTKYWIDTSQKSIVVKVYSESLSMWTSIGTTYVKILTTATGFDKFEKYDAVTLSGVNMSGGWTYNEYDFNASLVIWDKGEETISGTKYYYIIVTGLINTTYTQETPITFERKMPELDFVCENNNRLWGCSSTNHEIYACAQGNPCNWYRYAGLDDDSYAATVGTEGQFTGAVSYGGYVYFFKEDGYHKLYGSKPSQYELVYKPAKGIQMGSEKSVASSGDYLFYKAKDGVVMFDGSATVISDALGFDKYFDAIGGIFRNKYYISMRDAEYNYSLYVYDYKRGTWATDSIGRCQDIVSTTKNGLYIFLYKDTLDKSKLVIVNDEKLYTTIFPIRTDSISQNELSKHQPELAAEIISHPLSVGSALDSFYENLANVYGVTSAELKSFIKTRAWLPSSNTYAGYNQLDISQEGIIEWSFETGDMGMDSPFQKYIKRIYVRFLLDAYTSFRIKIMYDSSGLWENVMTYNCTKKRSYDVPLVIKRCDHFRLRFEGKGDFKLFSISKATEGGSGIGNI